MSLIISGSTRDFLENPGPDGGVSGWVFEELRIAFRDLAIASMPEKTHNLNLSSCKENV
jgi:hypothetical protein